MSWQRVNQLLPTQAGELSRRAQISGASVCRLWDEGVQKLFLARTANNQEAINFRDGVLTVAVASPMVAGELKAHEARIIRSINRVLGQPPVTAVRYR